MPKQPGLPTWREVAKQKLHTKIAENDPVQALEHHFGFICDEPQVEALRTIEKYKMTAIKGGNATGKTTLAAAYCDEWFRRYDDSIVVVTAEVSRQVRYRLFGEIRKYAYNYMETVEGRNSGWDIAPKAPMISSQDTNHMIIGFTAETDVAAESWHSPHLLLWIDEARGLKEEIWRSLISFHPKKVICTGIPGVPRGRFYKMFQNPTWGHVTIDARKSKWADQDIIKEVYGDLPESDPEYQIRVIGNFAEWVENPWFRWRDPDRPQGYSNDPLESAVNRSGFPESTPKVISWDPAKYKDFSAIIEYRGGYVMDNIINVQEDYSDLVKYVVKRHKEVTLDTVIVDEGSGGSELVPVTRCKFGPTKVKLYTDLRNAFELNQIRIPKHDELLHQLKTLQEGRTAEERIKIHAPDGSHDDLADSLAMGWAAISDHNYGEGYRFASTRGGRRPQHRVGGDSQWRR